MNINFEIVEKINEHKELYTATQNIIAGASMSAQGYYLIGTNLDQINTSKLWKQDNFDSFAAYTESVLGISKATAYRIIAVTNKFLKPEIEMTPNNQIFTPFQDTALAALNPVGDYATTAEFIDENEITPETPVSEIRKIVAEFQNEKRAGKEVDAESENENENSGENETTATRETLEAKITDFINAAYDVYEDSGKPKSKKRKTPINNFNKSLEAIKQILNLD